MSEHNKKKKRQRLNPTQDFQLMQLLLAHKDRVKAEGLTRSQFHAWAERELKFEVSPDILRDRARRQGVEFKVEHAEVRLASLGTAREMNHKVNPDAPKIRQRIDELELEVAVLKEELEKAQAAGINNAADLAGRVEKLEARPGGDSRVPALEQRVRELEAAAAKSARTADVLVELLARVGTTEKGLTEFRNTLAALRLAIDDVHKERISQNLRLVPPPAPIPPAQAKKS